VVALVASKASKAASETANIPRSNDHGEAEGEREREREAPREIERERERGEREREEGEKCATSRFTGFTCFTCCAESRATGFTGYLVKTSFQRQPEAADRGFL
jgi:hypothetical protein